MLDKLNAIGMSTEARDPFERVTVAPDPEGCPCPSEYRDQIMVDVIHDGNNVPERFLRDRRGALLPLTRVLPKTYRTERDWGAELMAASLTSALHLDAYYRVNTARVLLDFGRFPGITPKSADHMSRFAISYPFSEVLDFEQKRALLENYYDKISEGMDAAINRKLIKIAIHTYDEKNAGATRRPAVSILTRSHTHRKDPGNPVGLFDPMCPDELHEFTADRILRSRIALTLEEAAIHSADNYPYTLPEGSVEVRAQVWFFFRHVRMRYEQLHPPGRGRGDPKARQIVWDMLLDTNLRSTRSEALRSYLHMFRRAPDASGDLFGAARRAYEKIAAFVHKHRRELIMEYRNSPDRPSSILLEVRKDLIWEFNKGEPVGPRAADARMVARTIAQAVTEYVTNDRVARVEAIKRRDPRYH